MWWEKKKNYYTLFKFYIILLNYRSYHKVKKKKTYNNLAFRSIEKNPNLGFKYTQTIKVLFWFLTISHNIAAWCVLVAKGMRVLIIPIRWRIWIRVRIRIRMRIRILVRVWRHIVNCRWWPCVHHWLEPFVPHSSLLVHNRR